MKTAILLIGNPATGKTHFLQKQNIEEIEINFYSAKYDTYGFDLVGFCTNSEIEIQTFEKICKELNFKTYIFHVPDDKEKREEFYKDLAVFLETKK